MDENKTLVIATHYPASDATVQTVLDSHVATDDGYNDGRSPHFWMVLPTGDLILGVFPQGDTYSEIEVPVADDYTAAERDGNVGVIYLSRSDLADQDLAVHDITNPPSLLPMLNHSRVIKADVTFDDRGVGTGMVIAEHDGQYAVWRVWLHKGQTEWLAETGHYSSTLDRALVNYNERRS